MKVDPRFLTGQGPEIFNGNELILKGALECDGGVHLLAGYPGSPVAGFFDSMAYIKDLLNEKGIRAAINNNEALAAAMLNGSQSLGCRAIICMKSVGVHVAADALALGNLAGAHKSGGAIVIYGDDPWSDSTQVPSDSRYISKHLHMPVIEPANPQEIKDFIDLAFKVSCRSELFMGYIVPTNLADGGGTVQCKENQYPTFNTKQKNLFATKEIDLNKRVLLPPKTWWQEESLPDRHQRAAKAARELGLNKIEYSSSDKKPVGFITSGMAHGYLIQSLLEMDVLGEYPILKLGMTYPLDPVMVEELAQQCERIVVVEERRSFIEEQTAEILTELRQKQNLSVELWGKTFPGELEGLPSTRGLHPSIIIERLVPLLKYINKINASPSLDREIETIDTANKATVGQLPMRIPSFCPGCPHRDSASLCLDIKKRFMDPKYMRKVHKRDTVDMIFHGDIGCYTMLMFPPNTNLMHDLSGMGLGGGTGSGTDPFVDNKAAVFMGDSTFFHCGALAISQAIKLNQDITFIILDNSTTAMTGHQTTPELDFDVLGNPTAVQNIEDVVRGIASTTEIPIYRVNPEQHDEYRDLLEETFLADGVKIIIADKECGITRMRRKRREERTIRKQLGFLPRWKHMNINTDICRFCLACIEQTGCPGLKHVETEYGMKMDTDLTWCVNDGACERIGACSSFEHVTIKRQRPPRTRVPELDLDNIPEPQKRQANDLWRCCLTGVGGMGIGTATSIVVRAGHKEGYNVIFLDKKGLAIRNGGVVSQVVFNITKKPITAIIPYGKADLLLGVDILEAARALDPAGRMRVGSPDKTAAVINTDKIQTIRGLMGQEDFDVDELEKVIRSNTLSDDYLARNISRICETYLGSKLYANIMMLGFAFQKGMIPVSMHSIAWAIKDTIRTDFRKNLYAFNMGRKFVVQPDLFLGPPQRTGWRETLEERYRWTVRRYRNGELKGEILRELGSKTIAALPELDESLKRDVVVRLYDCMRWANMDYARKYADAVTTIYAKDDAAANFRATRAVINNLASAMLIKDLVFISELATSPEKYARDRKKYNINLANGDSITYRHLMHLNWEFRGKPRHLRLSVPGFALKTIKQMKWLRKLPRWRTTDMAFRTRYFDLIAGFHYTNRDEYDQAVSQLESPRCLECMNPLCREVGCPLENAIPEWIEMLNRGQWKKAVKRLHETNNFPEFTSEICPAPCQGACKNSLNTYPVQIRNIEREIVQRGFEKGWIKPQKAKLQTGKKIAIIGSGPAGLAAAQQLARAGHSVTVYERDDAPGGLLRYGIPSFRLDKALLDRRLDQLAREGVEFRTGVEVGKDITAEEIQNQYDAICLAVGATQPRDLDLPGRNLSGIHFALDYLRQDGAEGNGRIDVQGKRVVVIGGGDTGNDCVEMAVRQGATSVEQLELLDESAVKTDPTHRNPTDAKVRWSVMTKQFFGNSEHLSAVAASQVQWTQLGGKNRMLEIPNTDFTVNADIALLAVGFDSKADAKLAEAFDLNLDDMGRLDLSNQATNQDKVFAAGDVAMGPSLVVNAIAQGRTVAKKIDNYLRR